MHRTLVQFLAAASLAAPAVAETASPLKLAELSARAYAAGVEAGDPLLVLAAARLRKSVNPVRADRAPEGGTGGDGTLLTGEEMLATAERLSAGDPVLLGLIADTAAEGAKGVATGPVYSIGALGTGASDSYPSILFRAGEYAEVYVEAREAANLNLSIRDDRGRLVCADRDPSHIAYCGWTPATPGAFTLSVENLGPAQTSYVLMTN